jgi:ADP-ribose pyrophosphatase YjhB (NUDIX family)
MSAVRDVVDLGFRTAYRVAYRMMRTYWAVRRPHTRGSLIAVWNDGELLLVKNSYRYEYTLPGGYVRSGESVEEAGARELEEECGIVVPVSDIRLAYNGTKDYENRSDEVTILEVEVQTRPTIAVDNREVVWAGFKSPKATRALPIVPHLGEYLDQREAESS